MIDAITPVVGAVKAVAIMQAAKAGAEAGKEIASLGKEITALLDRNQELHPEMKSLSIDYKDRRSELAWVARPSGSMLRAHQLELDIPAGYQIHKVYANGFVPLELRWQEKGSKRIARDDRIAKDEQFLVILKGQIPASHLDDMIAMKPSISPERTEDQDSYWLQAAIKNPAAMAVLYEALNIERVDLKVSVAVERQFQSAINPEMKALLDERIKANKALAGKTRDINLARARLQSAQRKVGEKVTLARIHELIRALASGETFGNHVSADKPFDVSHVAPYQKFSVIPDAIDVGVVTDLSLQQPTAKGYLRYQKKKFQEHLAKQFEELPRAPEATQDKVAVTKKKYGKVFK